MNVYEKFIHDRIEFKVPNIKESKKNIYIFMLTKILQEYEKLAPELFLEFKNLKKIVITKNKEDIPCPQALGCATPDAVYSLYYDYLPMESVTISMEMAHAAIFNYFNDMKVSNDIIHYAANADVEPYVKWITYKYRTKADFLLKRPAISIPIYIYNLPYLALNKSQLMLEIKNGTAPKGKNPYWTKGMPASIAAEFMEYLHHYHAHDDHPHAH